MWPGQGLILHINPWAWPGRSWPGLGGKLLSIFYIFFYVLVFTLGC